MYNFIQKMHSGWAYIALLLLVFAVVNSLIGKSSKKEFTAKDRKIALFGLIATHIQLVIGLILYFVSDLGFKQLSGAAMNLVGASIGKYHRDCFNNCGLVKTQKGSY